MNEDQEKLLDAVTGAIERLNDRLTTIEKKCDVFLPALTVEELIERVERRTPPEYRTLTNNKGDTNG